MSTTAPQPVTTPIPAQLSEPEFIAFILPHHIPLNLVVRRVRRIPIPSRGEDLQIEHPV